MNKQEGFSVIEGLLIILVVVILGFTGWYVWISKRDLDTLNMQTANDSQSASFAKKKQNLKYLVIKEWHVKMPMNDANKVTYTYSAACDDQLGFGKCDSSMLVSVKPELYKSKECKISVSIYRYTSIDHIADSSFKKIGNHYFTGAGSTYDCQNIHDNELNTSIRAEFDYTKLVSQ